MRRIILSAMAVGMASIAAPSIAAEPGAYAKVEAGRASISSDYADDSNDIALGAALGYQYTPNLGFEVYTRSLSLNPFRGAFAKAGYYPERHYGIAVLGTAHLDDHFRLYGRAGIGRTTMEPNRSSMDSHDETDPVVGVGLGYAFNRHWSINLEATYLTKTEVNLVTVGVRWQF
jgi:opacity protein-like surface antigen